MKGLLLAVKDLSVMLRDRTALIFMFALPLAMILVLGLALGPIFSGSSQPLHFQVALVNHDGGQLSDILINDIFGANELAEQISLVEYQETSGAKRAVREGEFPAAIIIPAGFTEDVMTGGRSSIEVVGDPASAFVAHMVHSAVDRFTMAVSSRSIASEVAVRSLVDASGVQVPVEHYVYQAIALFEKADAERNIAVQSTQSNPEEGSRPDAMGYYAAAMGIMYLLFTVKTGGQSILEERQKGTLDRLLVAPVDRTQIIVGKLMGILLVGLLQFVIIIVVTALLFGVTWTSSLPALVIMIIAAVLGSSGLATLIASISTSEKTVDAIGTLTILVMSFVGGSMFPIYQMPGWMRLLGKFTLNGWALEGFLKLMFEGGGVTDILVPAGMLVLISGFCFGIGVVRIKSRI